MYSLCGSFFVFTTLCFEDHSNLLQWCFEAVCNFGKKNFLAWQCAECFDFSNVDDFAFSYAAFDGQDLVVLDELASAYEYNQVDRAKTGYLLENHEGVEIVITGRNPDEALIRHADYITEMKKIKHPFDLGISAREGIEY